MADVFGNLDLFSEFDKDREAQGSFIHYDEENARSRIIFEDYASEDDSESEEEIELNVDSKESDAGKADDDAEVDKDDGEIHVDETSEDIEDAKSNKAIVEDSGDASEHSLSVRGTESQKDLKLSAEDEKKIAWLNAQLHAEAADEANKQNKSAQQLIFERNKFRRYAKILDSTRYTPDDESPAVQLLFNNNSFARKYRQQIEQFIKSLLWEEYQTSKETLSEVTVKPGNPSCVEINSNLPVKNRTERMRQKHALIGNSQFHKRFLIDFLGWPFNVAEPTRCNINWQIPLYGQVFTEIYPPSKPTKQASNSKGSKPKSSCWNCQEPNHAVADCKKPRNPAKIAASRKEFLAQQSQSSGPKFSGPSRYHKDPELASKFTKFKPGVISDALRDALGLNEDQIPHHIYRMRLYGYPPGWLAEAKRVQSGVSIFDKQGRVALITGECLEDGELDDQEDADAKTEYDVNRIIEYPGFTVPVPLGIQDEHSLYEMPPIQQHQLKKTLMSQSADKAGSKKRKRRESDDDRAMDGKKLKAEGANGNTSDTEPGEVKDDGETTDLGELSEQTTMTPEIKHFSSTISISRDFGTPIFTRENSDLPDASKFGKDIEDHIPFENLPNATGTFEKMKDLLQIIRNRTKKQS